MILKFFQRKRPKVQIVRSGNVDWVESDANALAAFLETDTGKKYQAIVEDRVVHAAYRSECNEGYRLGLLESALYLRRLAIPKPELDDEALHDDAFIEQEFAEMHPPEGYSA